MSKNLKTIWASFETKTTRRLTAGGVENIAAPTRTEPDEHAHGMLPEDFVSPADAAFTALKGEILRAATNSAEGRSRRGRQRKEAQRLDNGRDGVAMLGASEAVADLVQALAATERRVGRPEQDYGAFMAANADRKLKGARRKKFLGLF